MKNETCDLCDREAVTGINEHNFCEYHGYPDMTQPTNWETEFDSEFMKDNGLGVEPSFSDPNGQYGPVKAFIRDLLTSQREALLKEVDEKVIGENEPDKYNGYNSEIHVHESLARNELRATQRQQLAKIKEIKL